MFIRRIPKMCAILQLVSAPYIEYLNWKLTNIHCILTENLNVLFSIALKITKQGKFRLKDGSCKRMTLTNKFCDVSTYMQGLLSNVLNLYGTFEFHYILDWLLSQQDFIPIPLWVNICLRDFISDRRIRSGMKSDRRSCDLCRAGISSYSNTENRPTPIINVPVGIFILEWALISIMMVLKKINFYNF